MEHAPSGPAFLSERVRAHYDELDAFYRDLWGEHLHHGLWLTGRETPAEAACQLAERAIEGARLHPGAAVCDVGCGYGGTARLLARAYGARVTALTLSEKQLAYARARARPGDAVAYRQMDWLSNDFPPGAFDALFAIECISHMADRRHFYAEAARVLKPGGRLAACVWLSGGAVPAWQQCHLLASIVRDGRLAALEPMAAHCAWLAEAGFEVETVRDLSRRVRRTWRVCLRRLACRLLTDRRYRRYLSDPHHAHRAFAAVPLRMWLAYHTGALRYGFFVARRALRAQLLKFPSHSPSSEAHARQVDPEVAPLAGPLRRYPAFAVDGQRPLL